MSIFLYKKISARYSQFYTYKNNYLICIKDLGKERNAKFIDNIITNVEIFVNKNLVLYIYDLSLKTLVVDIDLLK